ncbi:MAG: hypothetical protein M8866_00550, partial [marine benthic group bacterium]|nr:hypothetical protein [Candidatus Benthicola marisminoris]
MRIPNGSTALAAALIACGCGADDTSGPELSEVPVGDVAEFTADMNAHRISAGCAALAWHSATADVARAHSQDMQDRGFF